MRQLNARLLSPLTESGKRKIYIRSIYTVFSLREILGKTPSFSLLFSLSEILGDLPSFSLREK